MTTDEADKVIPSGALPPEQQDKVVTPELIMGKFETQADLEKAYGELESKVGKSGSELGDMRRNAQTLTSQLDKKDQAIADLQSKLAEKDQPLPQNDYEEQMAVLAKQVEDGDLDINDYIRQSNQLTKEHTEAKVMKAAEQKMSSLLQERDAKGVQDKFMDDNPDFAELQSSGALQEFVAQNPIHDEVSAYFALKSQSQFEAGKTEAARLAAGAPNADKVITKPGNSIQRTAPEVIKNDVDAKASMRAALDAMPE